MNRYIYTLLGTGYARKLFKHKKHPNIPSHDATGGSSSYVFQDDRATTSGGMVGKSRSLVSGK